MSCMYVCEVVRQSKLICPLLLRLSHTKTGVRSTLEIVEFKLSQRRKLLSVAVKFLM